MTVILLKTFASMVLSGVLGAWLSVLANAPTLTGLGVAVGSIGFLGFTLTLVWAGF